MLRIAVYSHYLQLVANVLEYAARYSAEKTLECIAKAYETMDALIADQSAVDAVFVDGSEDGVACATQLRKNDFRVPIVFVTQTKYFSVDAKSLDAMDILAYPMSYFAFATMLDRIQARLVSMDTPTVAFMTKQGARRMSVNEITYIESAGFHTVCHTTDGDININGSLSDAEKKLTADRFFRLGKYLINLGHVYKAVGKDIYVGTACLSLPPHKKGELLNSLLAYMNRG